MTYITGLRSYYQAVYVINQQKTQLRTKNRIIYIQITTNHKMTTLYKYAE